MKTIVMIIFVKLFLFVFFAKEEGEEGGGGGYVGVTNSESNR